MADGQLKVIANIGQIKPGSIVRPNSLELAPFSDCVVMKIENALNVTHHITLARPYAYVSSPDTTSPSILLGNEIFKIDFDKLNRYYVQVITSTGLRHDYVT